MLPVLSHGDRENCRFTALPFTIKAIGAQESRVAKERTVVSQLFHLPSVPRPIKLPRPVKTSENYQDLRDLSGHTRPIMTSETYQDLRDLSGLLRTIMTSETYQDVRDLS